MLFENYLKLLETECNQDILQTEFEKFKIEINIYRDSPVLLKPHLDDIIDRLVNHIASNKCYIYKTLNEIKSIIGTKCFSIFLPNSLNVLTTVLTSLKSSESWEESSILLLWLSIVCKNPFDFNRFKIPSSENSSGSITGDLRVLGQNYILQGPPLSLSAAYFLGLYISRPEISKIEFLPFLKWSLEHLEIQNNNLNNVEVKRAILLTLAYIFKYGNRNDLLSQALQLSVQIKNKFDISLDVPDVLFKANLKLLKRLILTILDPNTLDTNHTLTNSKKILNIPNKAPPFERVENYSKADISTHTQDDNVKNGFETLNNTSIENASSLDSFYFLKFVLEKMLEGLGKEALNINYTAAKGIASICLHLPPANVKQIVVTVLNQFTQQTSINLWHGGCLCLAELFRKHCLHSLVGFENEFLFDSGILPIMKKALFYEKRQLTVSHGNKVRDAACYVCWAMARSMYPIQKQAVLALAKDLINVSLFDVDDKCRRAASAAFQEMVGRYSEDYIPLGITALTMIDFYAVSVAKRCYLESAPNVATLKNKNSTGRFKTITGTSNVSNIERIHIGYSEYELQSFIGQKPTGSTLDNLDFFTDLFPYFESILRYLIHERLLTFWNVEVRLFAAQCLQAMFSQAFNLYFLTSSLLGDDDSKNDQKMLIIESLLQDPMVNAYHNLLQTFIQTAVNCYHTPQGNRGKKVEYPEKLNGSLLAISHIITSFVKLISNLTTKTKNDQNNDDNKVGNIEKNSLIHMSKIMEYNTFTTINSDISLLLRQCFVEPIDLHLIPLLESAIYITKDVPAIPSLEDIKVTYTNVEPWLKLLDGFHHYNNGQLSNLSATCFLIGTLWRTGCDNNLYYKLTETERVVNMELIVALMLNIVFPSMFYDLPDKAKYIDSELQNNGLFAFKALSQFLDQTKDFNETCQIVFVESIVLILQHYMSNLNGEGAFNLYACLTCLKILCLLPIKWLQPSYGQNVVGLNQKTTLDKVLNDLNRFCDPNHSYPPEIRSQALLTFVKLLMKLSADTDNSNMLKNEWKSKFTDKLIKCFTDHTLDSVKGDISAIVRLGSFPAFYIALNTLNFLDNSDLVQILPLAVSLSLNYVDSFRISVCEWLQNYIIPNLMTRKDLDSNLNIEMMYKIFCQSDENHDKDWSLIRNCYPVLLGLLDIPLYSQAVLNELILSLGYVSNNVNEPSSQCLQEYLSSSDQKIYNFSESLLLVYQTFRKSNPQTLKAFPLSFCCALLRGTDAFLNINTICFDEKYQRFFAQLLEDVIHLLNQAPKMNFEKLSVGLKVLGTCLFVEMDTSSDIAIQKTFTDYQRKILLIFMEKYLIHKLSRVRTTASNLLYQFFVIENPDDDKNKEICSLLTNTDWAEADPTILRAKQKQICDMYSIDYVFL